MVGTLPMKVIEYFVEIRLGVVNPEDYSSGAELSDITQTDAVIAAFFTYCHAAGLPRCPFYTGFTVQDILARFGNIFIPLNASYAAAQDWDNATLILQSLEIIKSTIRTNAYSPITSFPAMAQQLVGFETAIKNLTIEGIIAASTLGVAPTVDIPGTQPELPEWLPAVVCSDSPSIYNQTYQELEPSIRVLEKESFIGGEVWASIKVLCTGWPITAAWKFDGRYLCFDNEKLSADGINLGPFGGNTKNPVLFISNTIDPVTPIVNSKKWSPRYKGSQILTIEAIGVSFISLCISFGKLLNSLCNSIRLWQQTILARTQKSEPFSRLGNYRVMTQYVRWR